MPCIQPCFSSFCATQKDEALCKIAKIFCLHSTILSKIAWAGVCSEMTGPYVSIAYYHIFKVVFIKMDCPGPSFLLGVPYLYLNFWDYSFKGSMFLFFLFFHLYTFFHLLGALHFKEDVFTWTRPCAWVACKQWCRCLGFRGGGHRDVLHANGSDQKITYKILARSAAIASLVIVKSIAILWAMRWRRFGHHAPAF